MHKTHSSYPRGVVAATNLDRLDDATAFGLGLRPYFIQNGVNCFEHTSNLADSGLRGCHERNHLARKTVGHDIVCQL